MPAASSSSMRCACALPRWRAPSAASKAVSEHTEGPVPGPFHFMEGSSMSEQFDNVSVTKKANIYFDGKCVSHTVVMADGSKKSVGVIFPSNLVFNTGAPEIMELNA